MKKKTLIGFLASLGCLACLAGCGTTDTSGLQSAKDYIKELYKDAATETGADYERAGKITIQGVEYTIEWSVDTTAITVTKDANGNYVIDVDEGAEAAVNYVLTATITDPNGNKETLTYNYTMPKFRELTHAEFVATAVDKAVVVKGVITGVVNTDSKHEVYFEDADGGYYIYNLDATTTATLAVGQEIRVRGIRGDYYGTHQITEASVEILNANATAVTPNDITSIFEAAADVNATELTSLQSTLVEIKGVTILGQVSGDSTYYDFMLGENRSYARLSGSACMLSKDDQKAFKDAFNSHIGYSADVVGIVTLYNGKIYLSPVTANAFSNFQIAERTDAEKVDLEKTLMNGLAAKLTVSVDLQTAGSVYTDVAITWASNNETVAKVEGGKLVITRPAIGEADATVKITATLTAGTESTSVEYTVLVPAMPSTLPQAIASAPVVGTEYKMYLDQKNLNTTLYLAGGVESGFMKTTSVQEDAATITVEDAGDDKFYILSDGAYIGVTVKAYDTDGTTPKSFTLSEERNQTDAAKFYWDDENKALIAEIGAFIGTYNNYDTFSGSKLSYIASGNFVARLCTLVPADEWVDIFAPVDSGKTPVLPEVGKAYAFGMTQQNVNNGVYYITGEMAEYYMATTTDIANATATYIEETTGGYYFYTYINDVKTYINMVVSGTHVNGQYSTTASTVYTIDTENKTLIATVNDTAYWFGTRNDKTYTTMGPCAVSYKGFFGEFYEIDVEAHEHSYNSVVTEPTCTVDGYTTHTCTCSDSYTDTVVPATGHNFVDGACTVCTAPDPDYAGHEHEYTSVVTAPTCTVDGFTTYTCACEDSYTADVVPATGHADENADYKCDNDCGTVMAPAAESTLTIPQAIALGEALGAGKFTTDKYYMTVEIVKVYNTTYGNANVKDADGNTYVIYGLYTWDKAAKYDAMEYKPTTGDVITVYGVIGSYNGNTVSYQMKDGWIDEVVKHEHDLTSVVTDPTCTADGYTTHTCSICGYNYKDSTVAALGHTTEEGTCENCGKEIGGDAVVAEYVKVSSASEFTTGTYVLIVNTQNVTVSTYDGSWIKGSTLEAGETIDKETGDALAITLEVSDAGVKIKIGEQYMAPKGGNNNGIKVSDYNWAYEFDAEGNIIFKGVDSDTVYFAYNVQSSGFRGYKTSTVNGNVSGYPYTFTAYKLVG